MTDLTEIIIHSPTEVGPSRPNKRKSPDFE